MVGLTAEKEASLVTKATRRRAAILAAAEATDDVRRIHIIIIIVIILLLLLDIQQPSRPGLHLVLPQFTVMAQIPTSLKTPEACVADFCLIPVRQLEKPTWRKPLTRHP